MSSFSRRRLFALGAGLTLTACGFKPVHQSGSSVDAFIGDIQLPEATDPFSFAFRERLRRRFGDAGDGGAFLLESVTDVDESGIAIAQDSGITRYRLIGTAEFQLIEKSSEQVILGETVSAITGFDATSTAFSARAARQAAEDRLATELAELTAARVFAQLRETGA